MSVTRSLLWFGRMCPRVGRARRASLQYQDASDPKSAAGVQPVSSAERCNSKTVPGGSYSLGEWVTKSSSCLFATVGPQGTQARASSVPGGRDSGSSQFCTSRKERSFAICTQRCAPGAEEGAGGGGSFEAWPKQTSFAEKKKTKKPKPKHRTPERAPLLRAPSLHLGHAPQPRAFLRLLTRTNHVSSP